MTSRTHARLKKEYLLIDLIFQSGGFVGYCLQLVNLACEIRNETCVFVEFRLCQSKVIFAFLADDLLMLQRSDSLKTGRLTGPSATSQSRLEGRRPTFRFV